MMATPSRRLPTRRPLALLYCAAVDRNTRGAPINWRFTTRDARIKLDRIYPKL
jgi:hypothetical protein